MRWSCIGRGNGARAGWCWDFAIGGKQRQLAALGRSVLATDGVAVDARAADQLRHWLRQRLANPQQLNELVISAGKRFARGSCMMDELILSSGRDPTFDHGRQ